MAISSNCHSSKLMGKQKSLKSKKKKNLKKGKNQNLLNFEKADWIRFYVIINKQWVQFNQLT